MITNRKHPRLKRVLAQDGRLLGLDAAAFRDLSGAYSCSDIYEASPELKKFVEDEMARRKARDCRFSDKDAGKDSGAVIGTSRRKSTFAGYR